MNEEIKKIFENVQSEVLTEEVRAQISTLIEAKVSEKVNQKIDELDSEFETYKEQEIQKLEEKAVEYVDEYLVDQIDEYMNYVADEYMTENSLPIENSLKASMFDNIVSGIKNVLAENQIKEDEIKDKEELHESNIELNEEISDKMKIIMAKDKEIKGLKAISVFEKIASDLSDTDKEKLKTLSEDFDIDDLDEFGTKVATLKESLDGFTSSEDSEEENIPSSDEELDVGDDLSVSFKKSSPVLESFGEMAQYL